MTAFFGELAGRLDIHPGEGRLVVLLLAHSFFIGLTRTFADAAANALFLVNFNAQDLPYMYIGVSVVLTLTGLVYSNLEKRLPLRALLAANLGFIGLFLCGARLLLAVTDARWPTIILVIGFEVIWVLTSLAFWGLAGRIFTVRQGKRLFGLIGTGGVVATIFSGALIPLVVRGIGIPNLLLLAAGGIGLAFALMLMIFGAGAVETTPVRDTRRAYRDLLKNRYIVLIFIVAALAMMGRYFVDNAFYDQAEIQYPDGDGLASFLGVFLAVSGLLTLASRVLLSGSLISRYGVIGGLLALPVTLLVGAGSAAITGSLFGMAVPALFWLMALTRLIDRTLRLSVNRAAVQVLYQPLPVQQRLWVQTTSESIVEAIAGGAAGIGLILLHSAFSFGTVQISYGLVLILAFWILAVALLNREYIAALTKALASRKLGRMSLTLEDSASAAVLKRSLESPHAAEVLYALNMLEGLNHAEFNDLLVGLLGHKSPEVRQDALRRVEQRRLKSALGAVGERVRRETSPPLRGLALRTWAALDGLDLYPQLVPYLDDPFPEVSTGAMIGLLKYGGVDGGTPAGKKLVKWVHSPHPGERQAAARVLGEIGFPDLHAMLARLLRDENPEVQRAALTAAGKLRHPDLWPSVIRCLVSTSVYPAAVAALYTADESITPHLEQVFSDARHPREMVIRLARACGRIPGERITALLERCIGYPDEGVRSHLLASLRSRGYQAQDEAAVHRQILNEVELAVWTLAAVSDLGDEQALAVLRNALLYDIEQVKKRIFLLLSFIYDADSILRARENLHHPSRERRAYALEIIDVLLSGELKAILIPLFEESQSVHLLAALRERFPQRRLGRSGRLKDIIAGTHGSRWTKVCALYGVARSPAVEFSDAVNAALSDHDPLVQEMALRTLYNIAPGLYRLYLKSRRGDVDFDTTTPTVSEMEKRMQGGKMQLLTVEKVMILKTVSIFEETPDALLAEIAPILKEVEVPAGGKIIEKGELGNCLYIIVEGRVRVHDGERTLNTLGEREVVGEMALLDSEPRMASVTAAEETLLLRLDQDTFYELIADYPDVVRGIIRVLSRRLRALSAAGR